MKDAIFKTTRRAALRNSLAVGGAVLTASNVLADTSVKPRIMMMLFRGWEEACDGFSDYFVSRRKPVDLIIRDAGQNLNQVRRFVEEANDTKPDIVYLWGTSLAITALGPWDAAPSNRYIRDIPCVFNIVTEPVRSGIIRSREAPGREVTGTEYIAPVAVQERAMSLYRNFDSAATIYNPRERNSVLVVEDLRNTLQARQARLRELPIPLSADGRPDASTIPALVAEAKASGAQWLYIPPDTFLNDHRESLTNAALAVGLPTFAATERFVGFAAGLAGLVSRYYSVGAFTAYKAEQILDGRRASSIPVETLSRMSYLIRMETARKLGLFPSLSLLKIAEPV